MVAMRLLCCFDPFGSIGITMRSDGFRWVALGCTWLHLVAMRLLCGCLVVALRFLCGFYVVAMRLLGNYYVVSMWLLCGYYAVAI